MLLAECLVCLDSLETTKDIYAAPCGHVLHYTCWRQWFESSAGCPKCRVPTDLSRLIKLYITYSEKEDSETLRNKIDSLECELSCLAVDLETAIKDLKIEKADNMQLRVEKESLTKVVNDLTKLTETVNAEQLQKWKEEVEALRRYKDQTDELKNVKAELEKAKKDMQKQARLRPRDLEIIKRYQGIVEGLKTCSSEFEEMKRSNVLVKKLKIYTDDITGDIKKDVKKDPEKYAEMFLEVKKFWDMVEKREDEIKKSPKGCVVHLIGFPPGRKDVTKPVIQDRFQYYGAQVAYITYKPGDSEAFVRLKPTVSRPRNSAEMVVAKLPQRKLRIKNFTVDAIVLEGEEEIKFLRRSFEDRDRKLKRIEAGDSDCLHDNSEVGKLEFLMNLVALP